MILILFTLRFVGHVCIQSARKLWCWEGGTSISLRLIKHSRCTFVSPHRPRTCWIQTLGLTCLVALHPWSCCSWCTVCWMRPTSGQVRSPAVWPAFADLSQARKHTRLVDALHGVTFSSECGEQVAAFFPPRLSSTRSTICRHATLASELCEPSRAKPIHTHDNNAVTPVVR